MRSAGQARALGVAAATVLHELCRRSAWEECGDKWASGGRVALRGKHLCSVEGKVGVPLRRDYRRWEPHGRAAVVVGAPVPYNACSFALLTGIEAEDATAADRVAHEELHGGKEDTIHRQHGPRAVNAAAARRDSPCPIDHLMMIPVRRAEGC